jgi:hypothetical protein
VGLGGVMLNGLYGSQAMSKSPTEAHAILAANWRVTLVAEKAIYVILLAGLVLVWLSDGSWSLSDTWVWLSLALFVLAIVVANAMLLPAARATVRELREATTGGVAPDEARLTALGRRQAIGGSTLHLVTVVLLVLMIWKPGS